MNSPCIRGSGNYGRFREYLESIYKKSSLVQLSAGSSIPLLRKHLWLVTRGMVKLGSITYQGDELLLGIAGPNEIFGDILAGPETYEAKTLCNSDLLCLTYAGIESQPELAEILFLASCQRQRQSQSLLALMGLKRVEDRVKSFLELLAMDYGVPCNHGLRLEPRLTHQEIANAVGTTRVTVTRVLGQLRDLGWLTIDSQRGLILPMLPKK